MILLVLRRKLSFSLSSPFVVCSHDRHRMSRGRRWRSCRFEKASSAGLAHFATACANVTTRNLLISASETPDTHS